MSIPIRNADRSHVIASERTFFVTSSSWGKCGLLQSGRAAGLLIEVLYQYAPPQRLKALSEGAAFGIAKAMP